MGEGARDLESVISRESAYCSHHAPAPTHRAPATTRRAEDADDSGLVFFVGVRAMPQASLEAEPASMSTSANNASQHRDDPFGGFGDGGGPGSSAMVAADAALGVNASAGANVNEQQSAAVVVGPEVYLEYVGYVAMESSGFITMQVRAERFGPGARVLGPVL